MKERPYQHLPPLEHKPDGSPYRMTPAQWTVKAGKALICKAPQASNRGGR